MVRRLAGYSAVALAAAYLFFMYDETVTSGILVFILLYLPVSHAYLLLVKGNVTADLERVPAMGENGKRIRAGVTVRNDSRLAGIRYELILSVRDARDGKKKRKKKKYTGTVPAGGEETLWCEFVSGRCGSIEVRLEKLRVFDLLGIFCIGRKEDQACSVKIMPGFALMPLEITRKTREFQAESDDYSGEKKGDDPSEIYQVREYRVMDPLKDIHWKLSAKEDELMVKEKGFPLGCTVLIWFDIRESMTTSESFSAVAERAASLSVTLAEEKCIHMAAWYEEENERIVKYRVRDEEEAYNMVWHLLDLVTCRDIGKRDACFADEFRGLQFSSTVTIDSRGELWKDGEKPELLRL